MKKSNFVFFHVGNDTRQPVRLVKSVLRTNPDAEVHMVTDLDTPRIAGVSTTTFIKGDRRRLMTFRLKGFAALGLQEPAIYLDTDMEVVSPVDVLGLLGSHEVSLCRRSFGRELIFNHEFRGLDFSEYRGARMDDVYPVLACATVTSDCTPWLQMRNYVETLPDKFHVWYGDQEALRWYRSKEPSGAGQFDESEYACLPEEIVSVSRPPKIIHYKGFRK